MGEAGIEGMVYASYGFALVVRLLFAVAWIGVGIVRATGRSKAAGGLFIAGGCMALVGMAIGVITPLVTARVGGAEEMVRLNALVGFGTTTLSVIEWSLILAGVITLTRPPGRDPRDPDPE